MEAAYHIEHIIRIFIIVQEYRYLGGIPGTFVPDLSNLPMHGIHVDGRRCYRSNCNRGMSLEMVVYPRRVLED